MDYFHYEIFYKTPAVTTQQKIRAEPLFTKREKTEKISSEKHPNEMAVRNTKAEKQWEHRTMRKQEINSSMKPSYTNNHSKCKWIEFSNEKTQSARWIKNKSQQYAASGKHISALKTNIGSEWRYRRQYSKLMPNKRKQVLA